MKESSERKSDKPGSSDIVSSSTGSRESASQIKESRSDDFKFDGKRLIRDALIIDAVIYIIIAVQYVAVPLMVGTIFLDFAMLTTIALILAGLCIVGAIYYRLMPVSVLLNSWLLLIGTALFAYMAVMFNGPFNTYILALSLCLAILNGFSYALNSRGHWKGNFGHLFMALVVGAAVMVYLIFVYGTYLDFVVVIVVGLLTFMVIGPQLRMLYNHKFNIIKMFDTGFFQGGKIREHTIKKIAVLAVIIAGLSGVVYGGIIGWGQDITIKAPDDFQTISSYWGPPKLNLTTVNSNVSIIDLNTIHLSNDSLDLDPDLFRNGTLAYVTNVSEGGNVKNYANYSAGAQSYPNGTVRLSEPLPALHGDVNITFRYVSNNKLLEDLNISRSTLIMNYHGDFVYDDNIFHSIQKTYLLQLLDYWEIKFYLDIYNGIEFPHVFNYKDSIPIGNITLHWADGKFDMFQGISYDFEPASQAVPTGNPGGTNFTIGELYGDEEFWYRQKRSWYNSNEQNRTLFEEATAAYEDLYTEASDLGYNTYAVISGSSLTDAWDQDIDYTRLPVDPISRNPDVLYGAMVYQDNNFKQGRYRVYRACHDQIALLGEQGNTVLLGWLQLGTKYYTDDEVGLERYIQDCKIAQAAGMVEIFHAPIYRMQNKWGDKAVLRLHEALNEEIKEEITIEFPIGEMNESTLYDVVENLNYLWLAIPLYAFIGIQIVLLGAGGVLKRIKNRR